MKPPHWDFQVNSHLNVLINHCHRSTLHNKSNNLFLFWYKVAPHNVRSNLKCISLTSPIKKVCISRQETLTSQHVTELFPKA